MDFCSSIRRPGSQNISKQLNLAVIALKMAKSKVQY